MKENIFKQSIMHKNSNNRLGKYYDLKRFKI